MYHLFSYISRRALKIEHADVNALYTQSFSYPLLSTIMLMKGDRWESKANEITSKFYYCFPQFF